MDNYLIVPTVTVLLKEDGRKMIINESDFDDDLHELTEPDPVVEPAATPVSSLLGDAIEQAIEELSEIELEALTNPSEDLSQG